MSDPVLHLLAGPNGSGKSTFWQFVLGPVLHLEFVNADEIADRRWPGEAMAHAYEASGLAAARRRELMAARASFATETVFSHESKVELVEEAVGFGYLVTIHVIVVPPELAVDRVSNRVENGGHSVPEHKVRERYGRLWVNVAKAIGVAEDAHVYDNAAARTPFRPSAQFERGQLVWADWPAFAPKELLELR
jgi:predicted ABC-type ATPase